jgi:hypothetical protein
MASGDVAYDFTNLALKKFLTTQVDVSTSSRTDVDTELYGTASVTHDGAETNTILLKLTFSVNSISSGGVWDRRGGVNPFDPDKKYKLTVTEV